MAFCCKFVILAFSLLFFITEGLDYDSRKYCCSLGTNHSLTAANCDSTSTLKLNVASEHQSDCSRIVTTCCNNHQRKNQCDLGRKDSISPGGCASSTGERKSCCDACSLGIQAGKANDDCLDSLGIAVPYDQVFVACCNDKSFLQEVSSTTPSTTLSALTTLRTSSEPNYPLPSMMGLCESGETCAQICKPTENSYVCSCYKNYVLMEDGVSCQRIQSTSPSEGRCATYNPCDQKCTDTGTAIKCSCKEGYELGSDKRSCKDINECENNRHNCLATEECVNEEGSYACYESFDSLEDDLEVDTQCRPGYKFNGEKQVCDDIDECQFGITCERPNTCKNTIGSYICEEGENLNCPPGFFYKAAIESCADIDECLNGSHNCDEKTQVCLNIKGNYSCVNKRSDCPPGFKKNPTTQLCDDINECEEIVDVCTSDQMCINESGGHLCVPINNKTKPLEVFTTTAKINTVTCKVGYKLNKQLNFCMDVNECTESDDACDSSQDCINTSGSFTCVCKTGFTKDFKTGACVDVNECQLQTHDCTVAERCDNSIGSYHCARITGCGTGYTFNTANGLCEDDDECLLGVDNCHKLGANYHCFNLVGSYRCDRPTTHSTLRPTIRTTPTTRPTPSKSTTPLTTSTTVTSTTLKPTTPLTLPTTPKLVFQTNPPQTIIPYHKKTTPRPWFPLNPVIGGSLTNCLPGYQFNSNRECEDIDECLRNPCPQGTRCVNYLGSYQCTSPIQCRIGFEPDSEDRCIDINECEKGTHQCGDTQICQNHIGFYVCVCPPGHYKNNFNNRCEDLDECKTFKPCGVSSNCVNTIGSYKCECKSGLKSIGNQCVDINECEETNMLCEQNCVNTWGSYRCACKSGFSLNSDNRTCTDVDECERFKDRNLCIGECKNVPGSYICTCPSGYKLGSDGRVCIDIDECESNVCDKDQFCLNSRGSYKCYTIKCPENYIKDPQHKSRCKRPHTLCNVRDYRCSSMPEQYTYHFVTLTSNWKLLDDKQMLFQVNVPLWRDTRCEFKMRIKKVLAPSHIEQADEHYFKKQMPLVNKMQLFLVKSIQGPQEITVEIETRMFNRNDLIGNVVVYLIIVVSEYPF